MSKSNIPFEMSEQEQANWQRAADYSYVKSLPEVWPLAAERFQNTIALYDPHAKPEVKITYGELNQSIQQFAAGLQALGVQSGAHITLFADNSPRWLIADQGMILAGAANAVRSSQADSQELIYILEDSHSTSLVVEDLKTLKKLSSALNDLPIELVVLLSDEQPTEEQSFRIVNFSELMNLGKNHEFSRGQQNLDSLATLIYTSGTTGKPKGAMLSHGNLIYQIRVLSSILPFQAGDRALSILPTWHAYERTCEYYLLSQGCTLIYSNLRSIKQDLREFKPHCMVAVPRLWESIYEGVQKQLRSQSASKQKLAKFFLGISEDYIKARRVTQDLDLENLSPSASQRFLATIKSALLAPLHGLGEKLIYHKIRQATGGQIKVVVSGGGSLAKHLDNFYEIIGVTILVGYGLTETAPVANARRPWDNLKGACGQPLPGTAIKIVDPQTRQALPQGERGLVLIKGPQVMQGYYQKPEATAKAIDAEGWFDSGDLGYVTPKNNLVLTGRAKDTIVLTSGENIEPQPIENACVRSSYIDQIMLVGQDQKVLGALIVPNLDALEQWSREQGLGLNPQDPSFDLHHPAVQSLFRTELNREVKNRPGYRPDDRIGIFQLIQEPFSVENGMMTQTLKIKRPVVREHYRDIIDGMFAIK